MKSTLTKFMMIFSFVISIALPTSLAAAAEPREEQRIEQAALTPTQTDGAIQIAEAILNNKLQNTQEIFDKYFLEGIFIFDNPAKAQQLTNALDETVKTILRAFGDEQLDSLQNEAGKRFVDIINEGKKISSHKKEYSKFEQLPEDVQKQIAELLSDKELAQLIAVSSAQYRMFSDILMQRNLALYWGSADITEKIILGGHKGGVYSTAFMQDGNLISLGKRGLIKVWDTKTGELIKQITAYAASVGYAIFSPISHLLAIYYENNTIHVWNVETGQQINQLQADKFEEGKISALVFSPDGETLAIGLFTIILWNVKKGTFRKITGFQEQMASLAFSPDGGTLAAGDRRGGLYSLWNVKTLKKIKTIPFSGDLMGLQFFSDNKILGYERTSISFNIYDVFRRKEIARFYFDLMQGSEYRSAIQFSSDGRLFAAATQNNKVFIGNIKTGNVIQELQLKSNAVSVTFSRDGKMLAIGYEDGTIGLWGKK